MTDSTTCIRIADQADLDWLVEQHGAVYSAEFGFDSGFRDAIAGKLAAFLRNRTDFSRIWIGEVDRGPVATIAISERPGNSAFLNFVLVLPACRGKGIARAMMETALRHARNHGMAELRLETYSCLEDARRLYSRLGFRLTEVTPGISLYGQTFDREFWTLKL
ncbi:GNAT family N-acetyltransferase [Paracoccus denitrificans]|uniref:GNAT family N-acetyltransferase n=1 Tax=Paracoccus denitrificans TaxID=266 RepID=UPI000CEC7EE6|nr:GNAT family N-acetyltransferase [Paracoccus denitrificans]